MVFVVNDNGGGPFDDDDDDVDAFDGVLCGNVGTVVELPTIVSGGGCVEL